jgi:hypothetical protein
MRAIMPHYKLPTGRHSTASLQERLRQGPSEYLNVYTRTVIPQIEARIEERLLSEYMRKIPNELERQEIFNAYTLRRHRLSKMPEEADLLTEAAEKTKKRKTQQSDISNTITSFDGSGIRYHTYGNIGKYTVFPAQYRSRLFPSKVFGRIEINETKYNNTLGIMCREQGLRITNDLARLTLPSERSVNYE